MNYVIFVPVEVTRSRDIRCKNCLLRVRNHGYDFCTRQCGQEYKIKHSIFKSCLKCHRIYQNDIYGNYCSFACRNACDYRPDNRSHYSTYGLGKCLGCNAYPATHIYGNYCSFECRNIHYYQVYGHF
jgi:hypothetical protein